jgi:hypothetical protein
MSSDFDHGAIFRNVPGKNTPRHPWIVVSDPDMDPDNVLIVNLTDADKYHDDSCVLTPSDNSNIDKPSCVAYQYAKVTTLDKLNEADSRNLIEHKSWLDEKSMEKILDGASKSNELKGAHRKLLRDQRLID